MKRLTRTALTPGIDLLSDVDVQTVVEKYAPELLNKTHWMRQPNTSRLTDGTKGEFGFQKTNGDAVDVPLLYLTEVHLFKNLDEKRRYCAVIITVQINERTKTVKSTDTYCDVVTGKNIYTGVDVFDSTQLLSNGNVVQYGGWTSLSKVVAARNDELVKQGKFTQAQIDEMMTVDGYVHPLR